MHSANFFHQLEGCIAVGKEFMYIDNDEQIDINASKDTLKKIVHFLDTDEEHIIVIKDKIMMDKKQLFSSIKKGAKDSGNNGMAYRVYGCGINTGNPTLIVTLESLVILPK